MARILERLVQEKEIFNVFFEFDQKLRKELVLRILILLNKYYPSYKIISADWNEISSELNWEDFALNYKLTSEYDFSMMLKIPLIVQEINEGDEKVKALEAMRLYYGLEESTNRNSLGINFHGNVYTDVRYDWDHDNKIDVQIDQSKSAKMNREVMTSFLKELELLLNGEITEFLSPFYLDEKYIHKYGVKKEAVLKYNNQA